MKTNQGIGEAPGPENADLEQQGLLPEDTTLRQTRPFLKWAGGKGQLITRLLPLVPKEFVNYYEPFLGGGALFFALHRHGFKFKAYLTDRNTELINCYRIVKNRPDRASKVLGSVETTTLQRP